ncbi:DUF2249 domain-containing protein [Rhodoferax antarcticus]|nr:DUF2249 domain-containing protein [Rhodoferax antarcticus]APW47879.1 aminotransferase [Rhodoferax antarcticus]MCW2312271.1 uncharacterized protein (DUF2249 family) [Rhodoferax antarcticus]
MTQTGQAIQVNTRSMAPKERRSLVFGKFDQLGVNATMELINDQDPVTLRSQFELEKPNLFSWETLESGPEVWRVAVTKLKTKHGAGHCCGACGG